MGVAAAAGAVSAVGGIAQSISGARQAKKARQAIAAYERQDLSNVYSDLSVSTLGADLQREELARSTGASLDALRSGGARALVGGIGKLQEVNTSVARNIGVDLDEQERRIQEMVAGDELRIQQMQERREEQDLAGLGQQLNTGLQNQAGGIGTAVSGLGALAGAGLGSTTDKTTKTKGSPFQFINPSRANPSNINFSMPTKLG